MEMITFEEAYEIVICSTLQLGTEEITINDSLGRVLAEDVISDIEVPPFDKSAMDGYACRHDDLKGEMEIIEIIAAGQTPMQKIDVGKCSKIMTGAPIPEGADCVLMTEHSKEMGNNRVKAVKEFKKSNINYKGEDITIGQVVLQKGTLIKPQHIAVMASVGYSKPIVVKKPKVGIISTGDELVEPDQAPGLSQIRNSNAYQLIAQVKATGAIPLYMGIVEDSEEATYRIITEAMKVNDVVLLTGGVSMGDFDFVPAIMKKAGVQIFFDNIAVKPGKPTTFGKAGDKFLYGLPGNPVSSFVQFELLVKPLLYGMMGYDFNPVTIYIPMGIDFSRKNTNRKSWHPVYINDRGEAIPVEYHGSAHIHSLMKADGIISVSIGKDGLKKGEMVHVRQI